MSEAQRLALIELLDVVRDHNRSGTDWGTSQQFGRMMTALSNADRALAEQASGSGLKEIMETNAWRAAMIGLCQGRESDVGTPEKAADYLRRKLQASGKAQQAVGSELSDDEIDAWSTAMMKDYGAPYVALRNFARTVIGADRMLRDASLAEQAPSQSEQAAWFAGLDEGRAQKASGKAPEPQAVMFEVYEYAKLMDGFDSLEGDTRKEARKKAQTQASKIRSMLESIASGKAQQAAEPATNAPAYSDPLSDFQEGQWWIRELDEAAQSLTSDPENHDFKRAVAVVHNLLRAAAKAATPPETPAAQQAVGSEPIDSSAKESGARYQADAHLRALLRYTENFYGAAIKHGMRAGETANAIAHIERAGKALHQLVHAWADTAESRAHPPSDQASEGSEQAVPDAPRLIGTSERCIDLEDELFKLGRMSTAPCFRCGYNGPGYFQPASHPCALRHHALFHGEIMTKQDEASRLAEQNEALPVIGYLRATKDRMPVWDEDCICEDPVYPADPDGSDKDCISLPICDHAIATAALQELRAEVERLKVDAERLDWVDRHVTDVAVRNEATGKCLVISWNNGVDAMRVGKGHHKDWREAIDAARQPGAPGAEG